VFPAPLMSTIQELGAFLAREQAAGITSAPTPATTPAKEPAVEVPATQAEFNTDYKGSPAARP